MDGAFETQELTYLLIIGGEVTCLLLENQTSKMKAILKIFLKEAGIMLHCVLHSPDASAKRFPSARSSRDPFSAAHSACHGSDATVEISGSIRIESVHLHTCPLAGKLSQTGKRLMGKPGLLSLCNPVLWVETSG